MPFSSISSYSSRQLHYLAKPTLSLCLNVHTNPTNQCATIHKHTYPCTQTYTHTVCYIHIYKCTHQTISRQCRVSRVTFTFVASSRASREMMHHGFPSTSVALLYAFCPYHAETAYIHISMISGYTIPLVMANRAYDARSL